MGQTHGTATGQKYWSEIRGALTRPGDSSETGLKSQGARYWSETGLKSEGQRYWSETGLKSEGHSHGQGAKISKPPGKFSKMNNEK